MFGWFSRSKKKDKKKKAGEEPAKYEEPTTRPQQAIDTDTNTCIVINGAGPRDITPSERKEGEGSSERSHRYHVEYHVDEKNDHTKGKVLKDGTSSRSSTHSSDESSNNMNGASPMGIPTTAGRHGQDEMPDKSKIGQTDVKQTSQVTHELKKKKPHKPKHRHYHNNRESSDSETDSSSDSTCDESPSADDSNDSPAVEITNRSKTKKKSRSTIINAPGGIFDYGRNNKNKIVNIAYGGQKKKKNKDTDRSSRSQIKGQADAISSCKESATMPTSSPRPEDTSEVKVLKLQKSLKEMSTADDNGIQVCHLGRPSGSSAGNMRAQLNETESVFNQRVLVDLAKSIGIIKSPYGTFGTGFRVGCSYIMTAKHVKDYILNAVPSQLCEPVPPTRILHLNDAFIDFSYEVSIDDKQSIHTDDNHKFYFEPKIVYENDNMDTVILQLKPNTGMEFPPPLTAFAELSDPKGQLYLIGHSKAEIKRTDKFSSVQLTNEEKTSAKQWSERHIGMDGFTGIDNPERVLFHCTFEKGASGSPGVWICNKNNPHAYIVTMLLCGYPEWFYHDECPLEKKCIPHHHLVEQGVCMRSLFEDIKSTDPDLWQEIFCCNLPVSQNDDVEMKSM